MYLSKHTIKINEIFFNGRPKPVAHRPALKYLTRNCKDPLFFLRPSQGNSFFIFKSLYTKYEYSFTKYTLINYLPYLEQSMNIIPKTILLLNILLQTTYAPANILLTGPSDAPPGQTFTQTIRQIKRSPYSRAIYASCCAGAKSFAISRIAQGTDIFQPLIPERATVVANQEKVQKENPLFDADIIAFDFLFSTEEHIVATTTAQPNVIQFTTPVATTNLAIVDSTSPLQDASGATNIQIKTFVSDGTAQVFAAVTSSNHLTFGQENSGIARVIRKAIEIKEEGETKKGILFAQIDASGTLQENTSQIKAAKLDGTVPAVAKGGPATLANAIDMYWDTKLERLYCALQVTSSDAVGSAARALAVGRVTENNVFIFEPIIADNLLSSQTNNQIIATDCANESVTLHEIKVMHTSTGLAYTIVLGGNGINTQSQVFALPLATNAGNDTGKIASKNSDPVTLFKKPYPHGFLSRDIQALPQSALDLPTSDDRETQVGRGPLGAGNIQSISVFSDAVFASVTNDIHPEFAGVYTSRALFDAYGKIKGWTQWQRALGASGNVFTMQFDYSDGSALLFSETPGTPEQITVAKKTTWGPKPQSSALAISDIFLSKDTRHAWRLARQPGLENLGIVATSDSDNNMTYVTRGQVMLDLLIPAATPNNITFSGKSFEGIGTITATTIAYDVSTDETFIVVGGANGLFVLSNTMGEGVAGQLQPDLTNITDKCTFKKIEHYTDTHIIKLIADASFLYVLTNSTLERIDITERTFGLGNVAPITIAQKERFSDISPYGGFLDCVISNAVGLIATTGGLYQIGIGSSVQTALTSQQACWTIVPLGQSAKTPVELFSISPNNIETDVARNGGGNVLVLTQDIGSDQSQLYRLAIGEAGEYVQANTVKLFQDDILKNTSSAFLNFGKQKQHTFSDGIRYFISQSKNGKNSNTQLELINMNLAPQVGIRGIGSRIATLNTQAVGATAISSIISDPGTGALIISTDNGLRIQD